MNDDAVMVERPDDGTYCSWCDSRATTTYEGDPACVPCAERHAQRAADRVLTEAADFRRLAPAIGWFLAIAVLVALSWIVARPR